MNAPLIPVTLNPEWFETHGMSLQIGHSLGKWHVELEWRTVHEYSDEQGSHVETWQVSRSAKLLDFALATAIKQACVIIARRNGR